MEITTAKGRTLPANVVAYDHATGFGLLRPIGPIDVKPIKLGSSAGVESLDRLMTVGGGGEDSVTVATVVSRRAFAGYWEYSSTTRSSLRRRARPQRAALINKEGEWWAIGSLFVMDAVTPGERHPAMFFPIDLSSPLPRGDDPHRPARACAARGSAWSSLEEDGRIKVMRVSRTAPRRQPVSRPATIIRDRAGEARDLPDFYRRLWSSARPEWKEGKVLHGTRFAG